MSTSCEACGKLMDPERLGIPTCCSHAALVVLQDKDAEIARLKEERNTWRDYAQDRLEGWEETTKALKAEKARVKELEAAPQLTPEDNAALDALGPDLAGRIARGEPVGEHARLRSAVDAIKAASRDGRLDAFTVDAILAEFRE